MRDLVLLGARLLLGGYMGIHASQKLLGKFHGPGLDGAGAMFEKAGLSPGKPMAAAAAATEITGGVLTITGIAAPAGPLAVAGVMSVAAAHNREGGLMAIGALGGGALAGTLVAKMVTARPPQPKADAGPGPVPAAEPVHD